MISLEMRTLVFTNVVTDIVCMLVILLLWHQSCKRFGGTGFWVLDFAFQTAALFLIILRGSPGKRSNTVSGERMENGSIPLSTWDRSLTQMINLISQEAMNNIAKYSKASLVNLSLRKDDGKILLTIQDNGQGFNLETVKRGLGLSTMRERAQLSGGAFDLESAIGKGTIIHVSWPLIVGERG